MAWCRMVGVLVLMLVMDEVEVLRIFGGSEERRPGIPGWFSALVLRPNAYA